MINIFSTNTSLTTSFCFFSPFKILHDDNVIGSTPMLISDVTGEIRTGTEGAQNWVIQDDGYGFPCFYNPVKDETVHDDPRFEEDLSADLVAQREYVMQELRYSVYFCKDYCDRYSAAVGMDKKVILFRVISFFINTSIFFTACYGHCAAD